MSKLAEELGSCHYCGRTGRKRNLAKVIWLVNNNWNVYCPDCLQMVINSAMELEWNRKHGYRIEYPWRN